MITLIAVPLDDEYTLECSECGPVGIVSGNLHQTAVDHLAGHGVWAQPA